MGYPRNQHIWCIEIYYATKDEKARFRETNTFDVLK